MKLGAVGLFVRLPILPPAVEQEDEEGDNNDDRRSPAAEGCPIELQEGIGIAALVHDPIVVRLPLLGGLLGGGLGATPTHGKAEGFRSRELAERGSREEVVEADALGEAVADEGEA